MDEARLAGDAQVTLENWSMYGWPPDPDRLSLFYETGADMSVGYSNDRVDEILEVGRRTVDRDERKALYDELQEIVLEELPLGYLTYPTNVEGVNDAIEGWEPHPTEYEYGLRKIRV
jgi:peptide/nickel transport system substrate-binding protein